MVSHQCDGKRMVRKTVFFFGFWKPLVFRENFGTGYVFLNITCRLCNGGIMFFFRSWYFNDNICTRLEICFKKKKKFSKKIENTIKFDLI